MDESKNLKNVEVNEDEKYNIDTSTGQYLICFPNYNITLDNVRPIQNVISGKKNWAFIRGQSQVSVGLVNEEMICFFKIK